MSSNLMDRRAARAAWLRGAHALDRLDLTAAAGEFSTAIERDPDMTDAWLGLHAAAAEKQAAMDGLVRHAGRFGEERSRTRRQLQSRFSVGTYCTWRLEYVDDLWAAISTWHQSREEFDLAAQAEKRIVAHAGLSNFVAGRIAFSQGDNNRALACFGDADLREDRFLGAEAQLMRGVLLARAGALDVARTTLTSFIADAVLGDSASGEAYYFLGLIDRAAGREDAAAMNFQYGYALNPMLTVLQEEMNGLQTRAGIVAAPVADAASPRKEPHLGSGATSDAAVTVEGVLRELDGQIGQDELKRQVRAVVAQTRARVARAHAGLQQPRMTEHFVFTGPPGTGKTTIARILARLYNALGILEKGHVVEVDRSGLVGRYHGHTVAQTTTKLDEAMGGVLFIDEAYSLQTKGFVEGDPFGREAVEVLLKRMEDDRDNLVVIAAGYPEEMREWLDSNPGLRSRFTTVVDFPAYNSHELFLIGIRMATQSGDEITVDGEVMLDGILRHMEEQGELRKRSFGNGRFVRTLIEKAARRRDLRLFSVDGAQPDGRELVEITAEDILAGAGDMGLSV